MSFGARSAQRGVVLIAPMVPALVLALALAGGCRATPPHEGASAPRDIPPAPPEDLIAEATIATPDATWQRLQAGVIAGAGLLPTTLGGLVCAVTGLDASLGGEISGTSPAYLVVAGNLTMPSWVLATRLVEERRVRPLLEGKSAVFDARDAGPIVELAPKGRPAGRGDVAMGATAALVPGGWLVVGSSPAAIAQLVPYATRALGTKPVAAESIAADVTGAALGGSVAAAVSRRWSDAEHEMLDDDRKLRAAHGGRAPDFGDPRAIVSALDGWIQAKIAALRDLRGAHIAIDVGEDDVRAVVTASPASAAGPASALVASLHPGDVAPLANVPRSTVLAFLTRDDDAAARARDAAEFEAGFITTLGPRLTAGDAKRVRAAIDDWSAARGDWATLALTLTPAARGAVADVASTDPARASRAVRGAVDLFAQVPAIHEPVGAWLHARSVSFSTPLVPGVPGGGRASMATFATDEPAPLGLAWASSPAEATDAPRESARVPHLKLALGAAPLALLAAPVPGETLGDDPAIRLALRAVGPVAGAIVVQPRVLPGCAATGGVVLAWGARPNGTETPALWGMVVASDSSLRCAAKSLF